MPAYICVTCGVQHAPSDAPPAHCAICEDERQYVGWNGQRWTTLDEMRAAGYRNEVREEEPGLTGIGTTPQFSIGQRALLVRTPSGNVLWDCISYLDQETIDKVRALGGIRAIAFSHPHFYGLCVEWARAFDAQIYIPRADAEWIMRPDPLVRPWEGKVELAPAVTLVQTGGHFEGSAVLHWSATADGKGALLVGDTLQVVQDRRWVSFMRSYPNIIPLPAAEVRRIVGAVEPYRFDRVYGGWWGRNVTSDARAAVRRSAERYIRQVQG